MNNTEKVDLANAWIKLTKLSSKIGYENPKTEELLWSFEEIYDLTHKDPQTAWDVILTILKIDQSPIIVQNLSAGPLEDLLVYHGEQIIVLVEAEATKNQKFAKLLGGVWKNAIKDEIWNRVQAVWDRRGWDGNPE